MKKTVSEKELFEVAHEFGKTLIGGDVILLSGNLGVGKTTFTQGVAKALGVTDDVTSPTFTIMQQYIINDHKTATDLIHIDTYRVQEEMDLINIGAQDYIGNKDMITIIEWPDKLKELIENAQLKKVEILHTKDPDRRIVKIH